MLKTLKFITLIIILVSVPAFAQTNAQSTNINATNSATTNLSDKNDRSNKKEYVNSFMESEISLEELNKNQIYFYDQFLISNKSELKKTPKVFQRIVIDLLESSNENLSYQIKMDFVDGEQFTTNLQNVKNELNVFRNFVEKEGDEESYARFSKTGFQEQLINGTLVLKNADILSTIKVEKYGEKEDLVLMSGKVIIFYDSLEIRANRVLLNPKRKMIYAEGNLSFRDTDIQAKGEKLVLDGETETGFVYNVYGKMLNPDAADMYFRGELLKINHEEYFTFMKVFASMETNVDPTYSIYARQFDYFGKDKLLFDGIRLYVSDHPFFYFPAFLQDPSGTGLRMQYGLTYREGFYLINNIDFKHRVFNDVELQLHLMENLGQYLRINNANSKDGRSYKMNMALANYYINTPFSTSLSEEGFDNTIFATDGSLEKQNQFRYRVDFNQNRSLFPELKEKGVNNSFKYTVKWVSDPNFSSDLERNYTNFNRLQLEDPDRDETIYTARGNSGKSLSLNYNQSSKGYNFGLSGNWNYKIYEDNTVSDLNDPERFDTQLYQVNFPNFTFRTSGSIDPSRNAEKSEEEEKNNSFIINHKFNMDYKITESYANEEPYELKSIRNNLNLSESFSKQGGFKYNEKKDGEKLKAFDWSLSPSTGVNFKKEWVDIPGIVDDDNSDKNTMNWNFGVGMKMNFPSSHQQSVWKSYTGSKEMYPTANWSVNYKFSKKGESEDSRVLKDGLDEISAHNLGSSFSTKWNGYSLFYVPYLNTDANVSMGFSYDMKPELDENGKEKEVVYDKERISRWNGNFNWGMDYNNPHLNKKNTLSANYSMPYEIFDTKTKEIDPNVENFSTSLNYTFGQKNRSRGVFLLKNYNTSLKWNYFLEEEKYTSDSLSFSLGMSFNLLYFTDFSLSLSSRNSAPYRYFPKKAEALNLEPISFFEDVANGLGINGQEGLQEAFFKGSGVNLTATHDLDNWQLRFRYDLIPINLNGSDSLKGYYLEQRFSLDINLKKEFEPPNFNNEFPPWEQDYSPSELERLR